MKFALFVFTTAVLQLTVLATTKSYAFYQSLSKKDAEALAAWTPESKQNVWELSGQFQGDMLLNPDQINERNGLINPRYRWPNREIPYVISNYFTPEEANLIDWVLATEYAKTCLTVRPAISTDVDYVRVIGNKKGCFSKVGRQYGVQELNLNPNSCLRYGTIVHEFMHAAGFHHQQCATGRCNWISIMWNNIEAGKEHNFESYPATKVSDFGEEYDYDSVMHYSRYAFSINGEATIIPRNQTANIGQRDGLSPADIRKINKMYKCP